MKIKYFQILLFVVLYFCTSVLVRAQDAHAEIGFNVGAGFYLGDLNPTIPFHNSHPTFGLNAAYNMNSRLSVRLNALFGSVSGDKDKYSDRLPIGNYAFSNKFSNYNLRLEFNFFSYTFKKRQVGENFITPFIFAGIGSTTFGTDKRTSLGVPFGTGIKYKLTSKINVGAEWKFEQMNRDDLDNLIDPYHTGATSAKNNDWLSTFTFFLTLDIFPKVYQCIIKN